MANPRQRRKARSSTYRPVRSTNAKNLRKKPAIKGPAVLQKAWDKTKTVRQNYAALGLLANTNADIHAHTGEEVNIDVSSHKEDENAEDNNEVEETRVTTSAPVGISSGRLIRDAAGKVIGFETPDDDAAAGSSISIPGPSNTKVSSSDSGKKRKASAVSEELEKDETTPWGAPMAEDRVVAPVTAKTAVVQELEKLAASGVKKRRTASMHQVKWLQELVDMHGEDVEAMARDRRRNVWQKTPGELRRALGMARVG